MEGDIEILNLDMKPGNILKVKGKILADAPDFSINLGYNSRDLAFHFSPRFNESVIVCNSKCSDRWQTEHRDHHLSFCRGSTVKFFIEMLSDKFRVKLPDGHEVCFPNRHGYCKINYISIHGGLKMISLKLT
ncbi:PREDICTED: galectin-2 isoform X1 [Sturnus vulgaris]|uniref:galectin-2 isoform X1 n=1 Tax=Sturnus vulgaris TaxID=9172 RepID=UPI00071A3E66|nr:PREDICTED: galectin-2 isoform X1 [Sturnus vulgaris]XP_014740767.1 PREDICTED: galectin-2 isoform X1 [Sturnus vulgaris]